MSNEKENIDDWLHDILGNASADAEGIDWNAFAAKREKRRRVAFFWWTGAAALVLISVFVWRNFSNNSVLPYDTTHVSATKPGKSLEDMEKLTKSGTSGVYLGDAGISGSQSQRAPRSTASIPDKASEQPTVKNNEVIEAQIPLETEIGMEEMVIAPQQMENDPSPKPEERLIEKSVVKPKTSEKVKEELKLKKEGLFWQVQVGPSWNLPHFSVTETGKQFIHKDYQNIREHSEKGLWGFGIQAAVGKQIKKFSLELGLGVSMVEIGAIYDFTYSEKPISDVDGHIIGYNQSNPEQVQYSDRHKYVFVDIPLMVQYRFKQYQNGVFSLHLGMMNQFLNQLNGNLPNAVLLDQKDQLRTENFHSYSPSFDLGFEWLQHLGDKSDIAITPRYRKNLGFSQVQSLYKTDFNSFGLGISFRRKL